MDIWAEEIHKYICVIRKPQPTIKGIPNYSAMNIINFLYVLYKFKEGLIYIVRFWYDPEWDTDDDDD